jgi:UDP-N-acetylmuramate dehydrogenase
LIFTERLTEYGLSFLTDADTCRLCAIKAGGKAKYLISVKNREDFLCSIKLCKESEIPFVVLGGFSNTVIADKGFDGAVILTRGFEEFQIQKDTIRISAGAIFPSLSKKLMRQGLYVSSELSDIPGSIGGMVRGNAGAFGSSVSEVFISATVYDAENGRLLTLDKSDMSFSYRSSSLIQGGLYLLDAIFTLKEMAASEISAQMRILAEKRRATQPSEPSLGSFFKRAENKSAGELIDKLGMKGYACGGAAISKKHAGFIVNTGGATVNDIVQVAKEAEKRVFSEYGVKLQREAQII